MGAGGEGALGRSPGGAAAPPQRPQRPQAAENRPQGGLGCALWLAVCCGQDRKTVGMAGVGLSMPGGGGLWGAAPAALPRRRSGRRPLKTARRAVWAAPYGLRFAAAGIGKYWRSGAAGMGIETIRAKFF